MKINPNSQGMLVNKKELAAIFGISERTFTDYQRDPQFPFVKDGSRGEGNEYDTAQVFRYLLMIQEKKSSTDQSELAKAKTQESQANAALKTLQYHEKIGTLVLKDEVHDLLSNWASYANRQFRQSFDRFTEEVSSQCNVDVPPTLREKHATAAAERVRDYALKLGADSERSGGTVQPAEEADD